MLGEGTEKRFNQATVHVEGTKKGKQIKKLLKKVLKWFIFFIFLSSILSSYITFQLRPDLDDSLGLRVLQVCPHRSFWGIWGQNDPPARQVNTANTADADIRAQIYGLVNKCHHNYIPTACYWENEARRVFPCDMPALELINVVGRCERESNDNADKVSRRRR